MEGIFTGGSSRSGIGGDIDGGIFETTFRTDSV